MSGRIKIEIEPTRKLTTTAELQLLRDAVRQNPDSIPLRLRLARLLNKLDAFSETIDLLTLITSGVPNHDDKLRANIALINAYFSRNAVDDIKLAKHVAEDAVGLAQNDGDRAHLFAALAKAHLRLRQNDVAVPLLWKAIALDPHNVSAFKRLAMELLREDKPQEVIALTDNLRKQGVGHSRLLAARMMALAASGEHEAAENLLGASQFIHEKLIDAPTGWLDLTAFNAALAMEIICNPGMRFERYGTSSEKAWRVDHPATGDTPAVNALMTHITKVAEAHVVKCATHDHWWTSDCPKSAVLRSWCVMAEGDGYEKWHMHPDGWMSGGYYVDVPDAVVNGTDEAGCLAFGLPGGLIGENTAQNFAQTQVRPRPGLLTLFPSHAYHRTFPHHNEGSRMCIAFDICPM